MLFLPVGGASIVSAAHEVNSTYGLVRQKVNTRLDQSMTSSLRTDPPNGRGKLAESGTFEERFDDEKEPLPREGLVGSYLWFGMDQNPSQSPG